MIQKAKASGAEAFYPTAYEGDQMIIARQLRETNALFKAVYFVYASQPQFLQQAGKDGLYALSQSGFNKYVSRGDIYNADDNANAGIQTLRNNIKEFKRHLGPTTLASLNLASWAKNLA